MISRTAGYALCAMSYMARRPAVGWHVCSDISKATGIPSNYLSRVMGALKTHGFVESRRGRRGGFRIAVPADTVCLLDLVDTFDHLSARRACPWGLADCREGAFCPLHESWQGILCGVVDRLRETHLSDLMRGNGEETLTDLTKVAPHS